MRRLIFIYMFFCIGGIHVAIAQPSSAPGMLLGKAWEMTNNNPEQSLKIGTHLLKNSNNDNEKAAIALMMAESHYAKGNYNGALSMAFTTLQYARTGENKFSEAQADLLIAALLQSLLLDAQAHHYITEAKGISTQLPDEERQQIKAKLLRDEAQAYLSENDPDRALHLLGKTASKDYDALFVLGKAHLKKSDFDKSEENLHNASAYFIKLKPKNLLQIANIQNELGRLYFQQKKHRQAIDTLFSALAAADKLGNPRLQKDINKHLAVNFLALNDRIRYNYYNQKFLVLTDRIDAQENDATSLAYNLIGKEQETQIGLKKQYYSHLLYIAGGIFLLILLPGTILLFMNRAKERRYTEIIRYLEISRNSNPKILPIKKEPAKTLIIPAETEKALLAKLRRFESSTKFTNNEMSLAMLASLLDTNTKYLSDIIKRHHHENFNTYINKLRIGYIVNKMNTEPTYLNYKISYLAEESGFSSHSSFASIFKSITGIAPTIFIEFRKEELLKNKQPAS
jgi:YesN/AraC family two-component response regulator